MPRSSEPRCVRCGIGVLGAYDAKVTCTACRTRPPAFEAAYAPWEYAGPMRDVLHQFKYRHREHLGTWMAEEMAATSTRILPIDQIDAVVPVPQHWLKRFLRDAQPAAQLAIAVAGRLHKPTESSWLVCRRLRPSQTALTWHARRRNVCRAFRAHSPHIGGRTILLVDDVLTSGATAHACAHTLKAAGAKAVYVLTAARTPHRFK